MKRATLLALAAGFILFVALVIRNGGVSLAVAVAAAGWGLLWVTMYRLLTITTDALSWRALFVGSVRPTLGSLVRMRWIGESLNSLLPVAQVGGDFARARLATHLGIPGPEAGATVVVNFTLDLATQILYALVGVALMAAVGGAARGWLVGLLVAVLAVTGFYVAQRQAPFQKLVGVFRVLLGGGLWNSLAGDASQLDRNIAILYGRRKEVMICGGWCMITWLLHTGETWIALSYLGAPVSLAKALILESLGTAIRSAAFAVPGALGAQEGGFVLLGSQLGLTPQTSLALALVKRVRELLVGGPGLMAWMLTEGRSISGLLGKPAARGPKNDRS